jgi:hypothetical protein
LYREALEAARAGKARYAEDLYLYSPAGVFIAVSTDLARFGHPDESQALAERAVEWYRARDPEHYRKWTARALLFAGHADEALEIIGPLVEETPDSIVRRGGRGLLHHLPNHLLIQAPSQPAFFEFC